jgi:hypothetical protein
MKKVEGSGVQWSRYSTHEGIYYGPWYARDVTGHIVGSVLQCVGDKSHIWITHVNPQPGMGGFKRSCYAPSEARGMYYVECWVKHHHKIA